MKELDVFRYLKKYREDRTLYEHNLIDTDYNGYVIEVFSSAPASSSPAVQEQLQGEIASLAEKISSLQAIYLESSGPLPPEKGRGGDPGAVCQRSGLLGPCRRHGKGRAGMKGERPPDPLGVEKTGSVTKKAARDLVNFTPFL